MSWTHDRARVAALSRDRKPDDPDLLAAKRDLQASRAEEYIKRLVAEAPAFTAEQRSRIAVLLQSGGGSNATA
jgi:hypothetical protein